MKAYINNISVEGTPEEIIKYQELVKKMEKETQNEKFKFDMKKAIKDIEEITSKKPVVFGYPNAIL